MPVMKFRKRPVVIEAMRFEATYSGAQAVIDWINLETGWTPDQGGDPPAAYYYGDLTIKTLEGAMHAKDGDWIIRGVKGEFYPCKPDIFEATYEAEAPCLEAPHCDLPADHSGLHRHS